MWWKEDRQWDSAVVAKTASHLDAIIALFVSCSLLLICFFLVYWALASLACYEIAILCIAKLIKHCCVEIDKLLCASLCKELV